MKQFKIIPQIKKELMQIATGLPTVFDSTVEYHRLTGRELAEMEIQKDEQGMPLIPDAVYTWPMPVQLARNHYRILKKRYEKGGEPAVIKYIREVKAMQKIA